MTYENESRLKENDEAIGKACQLAEAAEKLLALPDNMLYGREVEIAKALALTSIALSLAYREKP